MSFIAASASYPVGEFRVWEHVTDNWEAWLVKAREAGASLAVFPEYGGIEAALTLGPDRACNLSGQVEIMAELEERYISFWQDMATRYELHILAPGFVLRLSPTAVCNRSYFFTPHGSYDYQQKIIPTVFEREAWALSGGGPLKLFETALGKFAVLICYDCEFPLLARAAVEAGADMILVPSATDTLAGYWRVRVGAMARALEGQCFVVQSCLVGASSWSPSTDENFGAAGFYGPPDIGFPADGVLAAGALNEPAWVTTEIDQSKISAVRAAGAVRIFQHWPEQCAALSTDVVPVCLKEKSR